MNKETAVLLDGAASATTTPQLIAVADNGASAAKYALSKRDEEGRKRAETTSQRQAEREARWKAEDEEDRKRAETTSQWKAKREARWKAEYEEVQRVRMAEERDAEARRLLVERREEEERIEENRFFEERDEEDCASTRAFRRRCI